MILSGPVPQTATPDTPGDLNQAKNRQTIVEFFNEIDPERSDDSPNSCRSRVTERTLTAPPVDPDRLPLSRQPSSARLSHFG
jgi:hypothetical protein